MVLGFLLNGTPGSKKKKKYILQLVKLEDLRIGDGKIIGQGNKLKYLKITKRPTQ